ncbi:MAG: GDSL-type esterase/lipase family protein [Bacteroidota bacterium]
MTQRLLILFLSILFLFAGCNEGETVTPDNNTPSTATNKIMPLGASRVQGARPEFESYRYELWKLLVDGNYAFDFIGTVDDEASYPTYSGQSFDLDHEGRGGWTSGQILDGIEAWLSQAGAPDVVLFSSPGGNDALDGQSYDQAVANVNTIIDIIQTANPNVTIIIEQLAPARSDLMTGQLKIFFDRMNQDVITIAADQTTETSQVLVVDMSTGFTDALLADDVHYNEAGARFIASRYYDILKNRLQQ